MDPLIRLAALWRGQVARNTAAAQQAARRAAGAEEASASEESGSEYEDGEEEEDREEQGGAAARARALQQAEEDELQKAIQVCSGWRTVESSARRMHGEACDLSRVVDPGWDLECLCLIASWEA